MTHSVKLGNRELLFVGLPKDANPIMMRDVNNYMVPVDVLFCKQNDTVITLPITYEWQPLGLVVQIAEEELERVMPKMIDRYMDFMDSKIVETYSLSASESLLSLMSRENIHLSSEFDDFECPNQWCENGYIDQVYGDKWRCDYCQANEDKQEEAQSRTFPQWYLMVREV